MPESEQERIISAFSKKSFGAPFIWEPETYLKGSGVREPADMVWTYKRTAFLVNMKAGNSTAERLHDANFRQLRGWVRAWVGGERLRGNNDWSSFDLAYDDVDLIVLISVAAGNDTFCDVRPTEFADEALSKKALLAVRLSPQVFLFLAERGGSACDLADLILYLSSLAEAVDEPGVLAHLEMMWRDACGRALSLCDVPRDVELDATISESVLRVLRMGRNDKSSTGVEASFPGDVFGIMNDWDFESTHLLIFTIADTLNKVRVPNPQGWWNSSQIGQKSTETCNVIVLASNALGRSENLEDALRKTHEHVRYVRQVSPRIPVLLVQAIVDGPAARDTKGFISLHGPDHYQLTVDTLISAAFLLRETRDISIQIT